MSNVTLIFASDKNSAIGCKNKLPWESPMELAMFKALTLGKTIVMGRKTAESLGRALPGRRNVVLTSQQTAPYPGMEVVNTVEQALALGDIIIVGGKSVYEQFEPYYTEVYYTQMLIEVKDADTHYDFKIKNGQEWDVIPVATNYAVEPFYRTIRTFKK